MSLHSVHASLWNDKSVATKSYVAGISETAFLMPGRKIGLANCLLHLCSSAQEDWHILLILVLEGIKDYIPQCVYQQPASKMNVVWATRAATYKPGYSIFPKKAQVGCFRIHYSLDCFQIHTPVDLM